MSYAGHPPSAAIFARPHNRASRFVQRPDYHEKDPRPGRERFYRENALRPGRWLRVVVDFNEDPGWIVTALVQDDDPRS